MARTNKKSELFSHLTDAYVLRKQTSSPGDTTLSQAEAKGVSVANVASSTNFTDTDWCLIDSAEASEVTRIEGTPASAMPLKYTTAFAHDSGVQFIELARARLGHMTDDGLQFSTPGDSNPIGSATRRLIVGYLDGHAELIGEFTLEGFNLENFATALGLLEGAVTGAGTAADPSRLVLDPAGFDDETDDLAFHFEGVRKNGDIVVVQFWGVEIDWTAFTTQLQRGAVAGVPIRIRATSAVSVEINTP